MNKTWRQMILAFIILGILAGCSSPKEQFIDAAIREGSVTDPKVLACAADKLQAEMGDERFLKLVEELGLIADKKKDKGDASLKLMGAYTVTTAACAVGDLFGLGGGEEK